MKLLKLLFVVIMGLNSLYLGAQADRPKKIRIIAVNNTETEKSISNTAELIYPLQINMPSAFTPNQDGLNDTFGYVGEGVAEMRLIIFNRWGEKVFESTNANDRWDGTFGGQSAPSGVYAYELYAKSYDQVSVHKKGSISLIK